MSSFPITIYVYSGCSTCGHALKWLREHQIEFVAKPIYEQPPTPDELNRMLSFQKGAVRKLFNTSGLAYREQKLAEKLPAMRDADALALLAGNGRLVKRPFVLGETFGLVGFDAVAWAAAFGK